MTLYTVQVTLKLDADGESSAYQRIERVLRPYVGSLTSGRIEHVDSEVIDTQPDEPPDEGDDSLRIMNESH